MKRLQSVDTLRGLTIIAMILVNNPGSWSSVYPPLLHAKWHGLTPTDLIFPFFLFIVGISIALAYKNQTPSKATYKKIVIRSLKLIGLGLFINVFTPNFPFIEELETLRIPGVLQRIGIVFFVSSVLFLNLTVKNIVSVITLLLISYFLFTGFIHLPNGAYPSFENNLNNWSNYIDYTILGKHMWRNTFDPEGLLSTLPSIITCLLGIIAGKILTYKNSSYKKEHLLFFYAVSLISLGYIWSIWYPINKTIWTGSFVLVTAGWASLALSIIYYINDIKNITLSKNLTYVSKNAITIYFLSMVIAKAFYLTKINNNETIHSWLFDTFFNNYIQITELASLLYALSVVSFYLLLSYILFKKNIFFKV